MNGTPTSGDPVLRLLLFVDNFDRHGTQGQLVQLANALEADASFHVHVGCLKRRGGFLDELAVPEERIVEFPLSRFYGPDGMRQMLRLWRFVRRHRIDLVHSQDFYANMLCVAACGWMSDPPLIVGRRYEAVSQRRVHRIGERVSYALASAVVTNSPVERDRLQGDFRIPGSRVHFIPNGVDLERFSPVRAERMESPMDEEDFPTLGVVARMVPEKGHDTVLAAVHSLTDRWPGIQLVFVGDGNFRPHLEEQIRRLGLQENVVLTGVQADVLPWIASFDIALLTPHWGEGIPNAVLEYLAAGCPVVATRVGGIPALVRHNREGLLVEPGDQEAVAESVAALLRDQGRRDAMARDARRRAESFSLDRMIETTRSLYLEMAGQGKEATTPGESNRQAALQ